MLNEEDRQPIASDVVRVLFKVTGVDHAGCNGYCSEGSEDFPTYYTIQTNPPLFLNDQNQQTYDYRESTCFSMYHDECWKQYTALAVDDNKMINRQQSYIYLVEDVSYNGTTGHLVKLPIFLDDNALKSSDVLEIFDDKHLKQLVRNYKFHPFPTGHIRRSWKFYRLVNCYSSEPTSPTGVISESGNYIFDLKLQHMCRNVVLQCLKSVVSPWVVERIVFDFVRVDICLPSCFSAQKDRYFNLIEPFKYHPHVEK